MPVWRLAQNGDLSYGGGMYQIRTIDELVDFYGGDTALAHVLGITQSAVAHWKIRKQIATGWHLRLAADLSRRGVTVDPQVFGLEPEHVEGLLPGPLGRKARAESLRA